MKAEIICVGTELLLGHVLNTNASFISQKLASVGIGTYYQTTVGDNPGRLSEALKLAVLRSDLVITSGGLGPTVDDITLKTIADALGRKMRFEPAIYSVIERAFAKRGFGNPPAEARKQAFIPFGSMWLKNGHGTAPGVMIEDKAAVIIALPGPPRELEPMLDNEVIPRLKERGYAQGGIIMTRTVRVTGEAEIFVNNRIKDLLSMSGDTTVGIYVQLGQVEVKITTKAACEKTALKNLDKVEKVLRKRLKSQIFGVDGETLESALGGLLARKRKTIAVAESCTGGLVSDRITNVPGSSDYFKAAIVAYSNDIKTGTLGVNPAMLRKNGAVSADVAAAMARGARKLGNADIAIGITGIAGPDGGSDKKPVGLVYISVASGKKVTTQKFTFRGSRKENKWLASTAALDMVRRRLTGAA